MCNIQAGPRPNPVKEPPGGVWGAHNRTAVRETSDIVPWPARGLRANRELRHRAVEKKYLQPSILAPRVPALGSQKENKKERDTAYLLIVTPLVKLWNQQSWDTSASTPGFLGSR